MADDPDIQWHQDFYNKLVAGAYLDARVAEFGLDSGFTRAQLIAGLTVRATSNT